MRLHRQGVALSLSCGEETLDNRQRHVAARFISALYFGDTNEPEYLLDMLMEKMPVDPHVRV